MDDAVKIDRLRVRRGRKTVLPGMSAAIPAGKVTGLLVPSGSGKTTLIRAIVGVQKLSGGTIDVLGHPAGAARLRSQIGYVTQSPSIYPDLSVAGNVRYFCAAYGIKKGAAHDAIDKVGLSAQASQTAGSLSGGQRARASLACALVANPRLLVLDEPTVGQDPVLREDLWRQFHRLAAAGVTVLVSSHVMDEASRCDRLLIIRDGVQVADDAPQRLLDETGADDLEHAFLSIVQRQDEQ